MESNPDATELICRRLSCNREEITDIWNSIIPCESLDVAMSQIKENDNIHLLWQSESLSLEEEVLEKLDRDTLQEELRKCLDSLTLREDMVIRLRYGIDDGIERTLEEVGQIMHVTRERIRQIEIKAFRKLLNPHRQLILHSFISYDDGGVLKSNNYIRSKQNISQNDIHHKTVNHIYNADEISYHRNRIKTVINKLDNNVQKQPEYSFEYAKKSLSEFIDIKYLKIDESYLIQKKSLTKDSFWDWISKNMKYSIKKGQIYRAFLTADSFLRSKKKIKQGLFRVTKVIDLMINLFQLLCVDDMFKNSHSADYITITDNLSLFLDYVINNLEKRKIIIDTYAMNNKSEKWFIEFTAMKI